MTTAHPAQVESRTGRAAAHVRAIVGGLFLLALLWLIPDPALPAARGELAGPPARSSTDAWSR